MRSLQTYYHEFKTNDFLRNNVIFFVGSQIVSVLNYLYYPVMGRLLSLKHFGELQVITSMFLQLTIFITVLTLISQNIVSNEKDNKFVNLTVSELEKITLYVAYGILLVTTLFSPVLMHSLKFDSVLPFIMIALVLVSGVSAGYRTAFLKGKSDFMSTTIENIISAGFRIVASTLLVVIGFNTAGAVGGILVGQLIALWYATIRAKRLGYIKHRSGVRPNWALLHPQAKYAGLVLFVLLINVLMFSIDTVLVKYLFSPEEAGEYAAIATISRIVLFLTGSFGIVLLSSVKISKPPQENSRLLLHSLWLTLALGGLTTLIFILFPAQVTHILFGHRYDSFVTLLPLLSIAILTISINNLIANYHIALRHYGVAVFVGIGGVATVLLLIMRHSSPMDIVSNLAIGSAVMLVGLVGWTGYRAGFRLR